MAWVYQPDTGWGSPSNNMGYPAQQPIIIAPPIPPNPTQHPSAAQMLTKKELKKAKRFWDEVEKMYTKKDGDKKTEDAKKKTTFSVFETFMLCASTNLFILTISSVWVFLIR